MCAVMDEGMAIAYEVLDEGVPVYSSDGELLGTVEHVVAAPIGGTVADLGARAGDQVTRGQRLATIEP